MSADLHAPGTNHEPASGAGRAVAIVASRFNETIVERLVDGARAALIGRGVDEQAIDTFRVPGALELPQCARAVAATGRYDAIVALGAVIKGDTYHFEVVCDASAAGLMQLSLTSDVVVTNGILTVYDVEQAEARSADDDRNKGAEAAVAAIETVAAIAGIED